MHLRRELHVGDRRADGDDARGHAEGAFYPYCIQTFFTHCSVSKLDRDHFQLTDAHFLYGIALKTLAMAGGDGGDGGKRHGGGPGNSGDIDARFTNARGWGVISRVLARDGAARARDGDSDAHRRAVPQGVRVGVFLTAGLSETLSLLSVRFPRRRGGGFEGFATRGDRGRRQSGGPATATGDDKRPARGARALD